MAVIRTFKRPGGDAAALRVRMRLCGRGFGGAPSLTGLGAHRNGCCMESGDPVYQLTDRLRPARTVRVSADELQATVSTWLAELGAASPLAGDLARAVRARDWPTVHSVSEYLSVEVTVAG
ncbi:hypothetical protein Mycsm_02686 [Mycobacterium sp. JS623]|uniref:hypothetical protein n=1 Tax=Mycobacterium sp. JS623 TaxID=212767 RepID=UPI0002A5B8F5|nr:hypothetical protein [Mycobacterium sp. JS623]AGB23015.1 hypothetical protein Mycsm_02686 [Mycobacterium sp. JS623]